MKEILDNFNELIQELTDSNSKFGIITEIIDVLFILLFVFILLKKIKSKFNVGKIVLFSILYCVALIVSFVCDLAFVNTILKYGILVIVLTIIILYSQEFRQKIDKSFHITSQSTNFTSNEERNEVINSLVNTAVYLSERKTGALITIEGQESLDSFINKSIIIKSVITQELLTTLFYVGTATHDGAVIIRRNTIMCAGAYLPSTDRYDIPKSLGTRHRAAIGISEKCDALTIIVSEETGKISVTRNGGIEIGITPTDLKQMLEEHILIK